MISPLNIICFSGSVCAGESRRKKYKRTNDMRNRMLSVLKRVLTITDSDIREMSDELQKMYPMPIAIYYEECIHEIIAEGKRL